MVKEVAGGSGPRVYWFWKLVKSECEEKLRLVGGRLEMLRFESSILNKWI
jgi:hypothetical protein